jgi:hypothetical protein
MPITTKDTVPIQKTSQEVKTQVEQTGGMTEQRLQAEQVKNEIIEEKKKSLMGKIKSIFETKDTTEEQKEKALIGPRNMRYEKEEAISHERGEAVVRFYLAHPRGQIGEYNEKTKKFENKSETSSVTSIAR